jgi:hypothetical protein
VWIRPYKSAGNTVVGTASVGWTVSKESPTEDVTIVATTNEIGFRRKTGADYYEPASDTSAELKCFSSFNNKRYFRYKVTLDSNIAQDATPQVDDVIINWSP